LRARVIGLRDEAVESDFCEKGQEQEEARVPSDQPASGFQRQRPNIGDLNFRIFVIGREFVGRGPSAR